jgi:hypothetical protein
MRSSALDRTGLHVPRNPKALAVSAIAHLVQLAPVGAR